MSQTGKDRSFFKFLDVLGEPGCPVCSLVVQDSLSYLDSLMYERITDVPTRRELLDSFGFCNSHTWQLSKIPRISAADLGFAIVAAGLLKKFDHLAAIRGGKKRRTLRSVFAKKTRTMRSRIKHKPCPACRHVAQFETYRLKELLDYLPEEEFFQKYRASQGICLPHLFLAEESYSDHPNFGQLLEIQATKARSLMETLEQFVEKHDHCRQDKITPTEARAGRAAMEFLSGKPGMFDNNIPRIPLRKRHRH
jgi:hypothetical protein